MSTTPFFSVIVAVHNTRPYLEECLDSILSQDHDDLEVIVVDDCSTDGSAEFLQARAPDPRIQVESHTRQSGPGPARNTGLARAGGRYVLFLDSDDAFRPGALTALRHRIEETAEPDVVVFDFVAWQEDGQTLPNPQRAHLTAAAQAGVFHLSQRPELVGIFNAPWSRAYRRDFIADAGLSFPSGFYEDIPWTMAGLMSARRIAGLDLPVVKYRQRSTGSILRSPSPRHFDVFAQWQSVFEALAEHPDWEQYRPVLFTFMIHQFDAMLSNPTRVPRESRRAFFGRAAAACQQHAPTGWSVPSAGALQGTRARLAALVRGNYPIYAGIVLAKSPLDRAKSRLRRASHPGWRSGG